MISRTAHRTPRVERDRGVERRVPVVALGRDRRRLGVAPVPRRLGWSPVEVADDRAAERERVLVVERLVVGDAGPPSVDLGAAQVLGRDVLAGRRLHEWRPAQEDRAGAADDDGLVAHRRDVGAAGGARAHDQRDLRDPCGRHARLVVEDPPEVVAIREDLRLERQERAAGVDEIDAGQPVLEGDLLGAEVLLDRHRVVGAALDGRVVGDDHAGRALDPADPGDDPGARVPRRRTGRSRPAGSARGTPNRGRAGDRCARGRAACRARDGGRSSDRRHRRRPRRRPPGAPGGRSTRVAIASWLARVSRRARIEPAAQDRHGGMIGRRRAGSAPGHPDDAPASPSARRPPTSGPAGAWFRGRATRLFRSAATQSDHRSQHAGDSQPTRENNVGRDGRCLAALVRGSIERLATRF